MGNCKDCRFWDTTREDTEPGWGECALAEIFVTPQFEHQRKEGAKMRPFGETSWSYELQRLGMETLPDYGCVQFEAKQ